MPSPFVQEVLIKSILVTLNDAVASEVSVRYSRQDITAVPRRFPPEKLRAVFKDLARRWCLTRPSRSLVVPEEDAKIDDKVYCA